jgi:hypothetical protein
MLAPKRLAATLAVAATLGGVAPAVAGAATTPTLPQLPGAGNNANLCLSGVVDLGPFGPLGPYGQSGPYGPNGPLAGQPNPIGNAASCGGLLTFILRGGSLQSFIQGSIPHSGN